MNNNSNKSYLSIQIHTKAKDLVSKLKILFNLKIIKISFSKKYRQNIVNHIIYIDDTNISLEYLQQKQPIGIKLPLLGNPELGYIRSVFVDIISFINEKHNNKIIAKNDKNTHEQIITATTRGILFVKQFSKRKVHLVLKILTNCKCTAYLKIYFLSNKTGIVSIRLLGRNKTTPTESTEFKGGRKGLGGFLNPW
ncbi:hypothetical protein [Candidatus Nitrosocosmicus hydrocola]|uniref:hypothetical protein n=1 Tax=Candidatus Nitrosocosmicus hydrocola TaxID=1826872 RepID=UPI0011E591BC|nr:hypothetical protein [Candidatus Nitrosocosmicus hydrocola]